MTAVPTKAHAELGASVAARWMACPGSIRLSRAVPTPPSTSYAAEGTAAHALAELALRRGVDPDTFVGTTLEGFEVTEEMAEHVRVFVDYCRSFIDRGDEHWVERKFSLAELHPPGPMFGTADFVAYNRGIVNVVDLKFGQGVVVEAAGNKQLRYYALGGVLSLGTGRQVDRVVMTIVQPRAAHADGMIRSETIPLEELLAFAAELMDAARATTAPDAPLAPGSHCRFCPASGVCPAQLERAQAIAQVEFASLPVDRPPAPETLPPAVLADFLSKLPILDDWIAALREHGRLILERGEHLPGYKLVAKRATRRWVDEAETRQWLESQGYREEEILKSELRSPAQIEKVVGKKRLPTEMVASVSSGTKMVPASDPAPAVVVTRGEEFPLLTSGDE